MEKVRLSHSLIFTVGLLLCSFSYIDVELRNMKPLVHYLNCFLEFNRILLKVLCCKSLTNGLITPPTNAAALKLMK